MAVHEAYDEMGHMPHWVAVPRVSGDGYVARQPLFDPFLTKVFLIGIAGGLTGMTVFCMLCAVLAPMVLP